MAALGRWGFESQVLSTTQAIHGESDNSAAGLLVQSAGSPVIDTVRPHQMGTPARGGVACLKCPANAANYFQVSTPWVLDRHYYIRAYIDLSDATPDATSSLIQVLAASIQVCALRLVTAQPGKLQAIDSNGNPIGSVSASLADATYACVELHFMIPTAGNGVVEARLNGTTFVSSSAVDVNNSVAANVLLRIGHCSSTTTNHDIRLDDIALNDDQGANQNSWCGEGVIGVLKPVSDNNRVGWVGGSGGTTNLFNGVKTIPSVGTSIGAASTDSTQIEDANNNSTDTYAANVGAYSDSVASGGLGILSGDSITLVQAYARGSGSSATGRQKGVEGVSNPAMAEVTVSTGGAVAAAEPTGWRTHRTAFAYAPSVTLGTKPVVRVRKATATTDTLTFDQMGLTVEFLPALPVDSAAETLKWDLPAEVSNGLSAKWDLFTDIANSETLLWDLIAQVSSNTQELIWDATGQVNAAPLNAKWDLFGAVSSDVDLLWNLASQMTSDPATLVWDLMAATDADQQRLIWNLITSLSSPAQSLLWDLRAEVGSTISAKWDLFAERDNIISLIWDLETFGQVNSDPQVFIWNLAAAVAALTRIKWDLRVEVNRASASIIWDLRSAVDANELRLRADLYNAVDQAVTLPWSLSGEVAALRTLVWDMEAEEIGRWPLLPEGPWVVVDELHRWDATAEGPWIPDTEVGRWPLTDEDEWESS